MCKNYTINTFSAYFKYVTYGMHELIGLSATQSVDFRDVISHELAPILTSLFTESGELSIPSNKAILKDKLKVKQSCRLLKPEVVVIDGCAIIWVITWPSSGTVRDYCNAFCSYILKRLDLSDIYLIFERYNEDTIKKGTRQSRAKSGSRIRKLNMTSPLLSQSVILSVTKNKIQIIKYIIQTLIDTVTEQSHKNKLCSCNWTFSYLYSYSKW